MLNKDGCSWWYRVRRVKEEQRKWKVVSLTVYNGVSVTCSYALFETLGILYQHALYILKKKKVLELPEQLPRWTLSGRYHMGHTDVGTQQTCRTPFGATPIDF